MEENAENLEDPGFATPEAPVEPPPKEPETETPAPEEPPKEHEPPPDHPRFKEIYGKAKQLERDLENVNSKFNMLYEHNTKLSEALDSIQSKAHQNERPDPLEDPDGYASWVKEDVRRDMEKQVQPPPQQQSQQVHPLQVMEQTVATIHEDYWQAFGDVNPELQTNPELQREIMGAQNPPLALYNYWKGKKTHAAQQRDGALNQGFVEGSTTPPAKTTKRVLTNSEKRTAENLGITPDAYLKQVIFMEKRGY